jgi:hypothetical protein
MALALPLLERIAPDVEPPLAYRAGAEPPRIVRADAPLAAAYEEAARAAGAHWRIAKPPSLVLDVDTIEDLGVLRAALDARTGGAAHTRGLLSRLGRR